jgi:DNA-binding transcriptional LysR family regulator
MTLHQLQYFKRLAEVRHYTNAARELHISQPSLSQAVHALEEELGVLLFDKSHKKIILTSAGRIFYAHVVKVLEVLDEGVRETRSIGGAYQEIIRVGAIYSMGFQLLPRLIDGFYQQVDRDRVKFSFVQNVNDYLVADLQGHQIDVALLTEPGEALESLAVLEQELFVVVNAAHPLAGHQTVRMDQIKDETLILTTPESGLRRFLERAFKRLKISPKILFDAAECNAILSHVALDQGVGIIPDIPAMDREGVKILRIEDPGFRRKIYLAWPRGEALSEEVRRFIDFVALQYGIKEAPSE